MAEIITTLHPEGQKKDNLYPNIKPANIPIRAINLNHLSNEVINLIKSGKDGSPSYVSTSINILGLTSNKGLAVATDNGHWYYWNGTQYVDGGTYQATAIEENGVEYNNLDLYIKDYLNLLGRYPYKEYNGYMISNGNINRVDNIHCYTIEKTPCKSGDVFLYKGRGRSSAYSCIFFDANNSVISSLQIDNWESEEFYKIIAPTNSSSVKFSSYQVLANPIVLEVYKMSDTFYSNFEDMKNKVFSKKEYKEANGWLGNLGNWNAQSDYHSLYVDYECQEGDIFLYKGRGGSNPCSHIFYDGDEIISAYHLNSKYEFTEIVIPSGVTKVRFASFEPNGTDVILEVFDLKRLDGKVKSLETKEYVPSSIYNKNWYVVGDSYSYGDFSGLDQSQYKFSDGKYAGMNKVYMYHIALRTGCNIFNFSQGGRTLANRPNGATIDNSFSYANGLYTQIPNTADIITIYLGINDKNYSVPIGTITDSTNTTFYGAFNIVLQYLMTNCPKAKIGIVVSNSTNDDIYNATINIAKKYGLSYLNLDGDTTLPMVINANHREGLDTTIKEYWINKYKVSDTNGHPNVQAHEDESYVIQQWLERL